ncbi:Hypothetical protein I5071_30450 [Sandaracinus amylolyticus]|nr:Hypothetical protein I5071_30450 [Sandaracinus amylolyticus]
MLACAMLCVLPCAHAQDAGVDEQELEDESALEEEEEAPASEEDEEPAAEEEGDAYREAYGDEDETAEGEEAAEGEEEAAEAEAEAEEEATETAEGDDSIPEPHTTRFVSEPPIPAEGDFQLAIPPVLVERRGGIATTAVFPLFYLRESPDASELVIPPIYHREGVEQADVVFPAFWWFRGPQWHTLIIPPFWHHDSPEGHDIGVAPLFMSGRHRQSYYHVIPPLLTVGWGDEDEDYLFAGALFYRLRMRDEERWGVFPFLWWYDTPNEQYQFVAPFVFRHRNARSEQTLTIVPPGLFYLSEQPRESWWGIAGLLHHDEGPGFHSTTIPPLLFHFSEDPNAFRLTTPLFAYFRERDSETLVTWLYQMHRGATEADMVAPLFFWIRDPRERSETLVIPPLLFARWSSPASSNTIVFPFFAHFDEYGRRQTWITPLVGNSRDLEHGDETTWIAPTIQISRWRDGEAFNIHPLWYYEHVPSHRHYVFAPFWFDFEQYERGDRYTVAFPFYWRFREGVTETQLFLNTYFRRREWRNEERWEYEFHFAPLFDYGQTSAGEHWWRVLYGLVGWEHRNRHDRLWLFYIPIDFGHAPIQPAEPRTEPASESALSIPTYTLQ